MLADDLLAIAVDAATAAAHYIASSVARQVDTKSSPTDMVTEVDRASEALVVERLLAQRPDDGVIGEEGASREGTSGTRWIIDPLDGTTNFLYRLPPFAVSIAAQVDSDIVAGVVYDVAHHEVFTATKGGGAFCNGSQLHVRGAASLATALIGTGFAYEPQRRTEQAAVLAPLLGSVRDIRRSGSATVDLCWVAAARLDGYYESGLQLWDRAAGSLIAAEAGAWVGEVGTTTIAIAPHLADDFVALLQRAGR